MRVRISWNKATEQWRMEWASNGMFVQEFFDCENFHRVFKNASKKKPTIYRMRAEYVVSEGF
jgi:hypothetical protein